MFSGLEWRDGRLVCAGMEFHLFSEATPSGADEGGGAGRHQLLYKSERLLAQYMRVWSQRPARPVGNLIELGIFHGGSVILWHELLRPKKHIAIDIAPAPLSNRLQEYIEARDATGQIELHWSVDQAEPDCLKQIVDAALKGEPIDIVVD